MNTPAHKPQTTQPVLSIQDLHLSFPVFGGEVHALNGVTMDVMPGEIVGVVGESGSGKSVSSMMALKLLPKDSFRITSGHITLAGVDVLAASEERMQRLRGKDVAMIFQEPMTALNPTQRIGRQLATVLRLHQPLSAHAARTKAEQLLAEMMIPDARDVLHAYPFELSGGMRQRVMVAMAFSCEPKLLIADEPTTALDVTVQRQVLQLLRYKARQRQAAVLFITHDMAVVSQLCDRVYVMYAGKVVEQGPTQAVLTQPMHPYTRGLLDGLPENAAAQTRLHTIRGQAPDMRNLPTGCVFRERCPLADAACLEVPALTTRHDPSRQVACWHPLLPDAGDKHGD